FSRDAAHPPSPPHTGDRAQQVANGEYLTRAGGCLACHTERGEPAYGGGLPLPTVFGVLYAPNITPDPEDGIGNWSEEDFWHALHEGRAKDGTLLYPGFPYTNYTKVVRADANGIFAYLRSIPPIHKARRPHELRFPYNERKLLIAWRALYFRAGEYDADPAQTKEWNRGAYLVNALGHCDMC